MRDTSEASGPPKQAGLRGLPARLRRVTTHGTYVSQIDGMRFLALLPVLFWHAGLRGLRSVPTGSTAVLQGFDQWLPNGRVGVELFFFISGYIIAFPFLSHRPPSLARFYKRRVLRIEPPYVLVMGLCFVLLAGTGFRPSHAAVFAAAHGPLWPSLLASLAYLHVIIFQWEPFLNPPAWSLEVEVEFYLLSPFLLHGLLIVRRDILRRSLLICLIVCALLTSSVLLQSRQSVHQLTILGHSWSFLLGILVCDIALKQRPFDSPDSHLFDLLLVSGYVILLILGVYEDRDFSFGFLLGRDSLKAGAIILVFLGAARGTLGRRVLGSGWIALIGGACYSIYLTHVPAMQACSELIYRFVHLRDRFAAWAFSVIVLIPIAIAIGLIFYALVERPCMQRDWPARLLSRIKAWRNSVRPEFPVSGHGGP